MSKQSQKQNLWNRWFVEAPTPHPLPNKTQDQIDIVRIKMIEDYGFMFIIMLWLYAPNKKK